MALNNDEHPCPHHYMSQACVAGGFFCFDFCFWLVFIQPHAGQMKKPWGRGLGRETEREKNHLNN